MKLFIILLIFSFHALAVDRIQLHFSSPEIRQGAMVRGVLRLDPAALNVPVQKLTGVNFSETIYFHKISPLLKKEAADSYEAEVQVIFSKVPDSETLTGKIGQSEVALQWNPVRILPVEAPGQMLWADFTAPDFWDGHWKWLGAALCLLLLGFGAYRLWLRLDKKKKEKARRLKIAEEIRSCAAYEDVVKLWQRKRTYLKDFPQLEPGFEKLERVLFKFQFKPMQTEEDKNSVMRAYRQFLEEHGGGLRGV